MADVYPNSTSALLSVIQIPHKIGMPTASLEQRRAAFLGVVSSAIRVDDLIGSLLGRQLGSDFDLVIHDRHVYGAAPPGAEEGHG